MNCVRLAVVGFVAAGAAAQCFVPVGHPAGSVESPGGGACGQAVPCSTYQTCPQNDTCASAACGWNGCGTMGVANMPCYGYSGGTCNTITWTCSAGIPTGPNGVMAAVTFLKGTGGACGGCMPDGGGEP